MCRVEDLLARSRGYLQRLLGPKTGDTLYLFARGQDPRRLEPFRRRKSVSVDLNWGVRCANDAEVDAVLANVAQELASRLQRQAARAHTFTLKVLLGPSLSPLLPSDRDAQLMRRHPEAPVEPAKFLGHGHVEVFSRSVSLASATRDAATILRETRALYKALAVPPPDLRGPPIVLFPTPSPPSPLYSSAPPGVGLQSTRLEFDAEAHQPAGVVGAAKLVQAPCRLSPHQPTLSQQFRRFNGAEGAKQPAGPLQRGADVEVRHKEAPVILQGHVGIAREPGISRDEASFVKSSKRKAPRAEFPRVRD
jgi:hypothetical protein